MNKLITISIVALLAIGCSKKVNVVDNTDVDVTLEVNTPVTAESLNSRLISLTTKMVGYLDVFPVDSLNIPRSIDEDGSLIGTKSRQWTSGFFPGTLWQLAPYDESGTVKNYAMFWANFVEKEKWDTHTHDLGFKVNSAFGKWNNRDHRTKNDEIITQASKTLILRYNETVGAIRSWDFNKDQWQYPVIIDNMMNLEMLFDATEITGDSIYYDIAYKHAETTLQNHFRSDQSSYHVIDYDTLSGKIRNRHTHQGLNHESAWSRGQAWGLYGFAMAYDRTGDERFKEQANAIAQFFFTHPHLPEDLIPYWDFDAIDIPNEPRDVSAAAVAANGLMILAEYDAANRDQYLEWTDTILSSLQKDEYQSDKIPFLLDHSTGSVPGDFEVDKPIVYGDYYYVEALIRRLATIE